MTRTAASLVLALLAVVLGSCATTEEPAPPAEVRDVTFICEQSRLIRVEFSEGQAVVFASGDPVRLTQQPVASGVHYTGGGHELRGQGAEMRWTDSAGNTHVCRDQAAEMRRPQIQEPMQALAGTMWRLVHFQSSDDAIGIVAPSNRERYTLNFMPDGTLAMQLDCNRGSARWEAQPESANMGTLRISPGAMTRAFCGPGAWDTRLSADLSRVQSYVFAGGRLHLALQLDSGIYVFEPAGSLGERG